MADYIVCVTNFSSTSDYLFFADWDEEYEVIWTEKMSEARKMPMSTALNVIESLAFKQEFDEIMLKRI